MIAEEPIAADFRIKEGQGIREGFTSSEAYSLQLARAENVTKREIKKRAEAYSLQLQLMKLKIIAGVLGVPLEELRNRDKVYQLELARKRSRRFFIIAIFMTILFCVAVGLGVMFNNERKEAEHALAVVEFREAQRHYENNDLSHALAHLAQSVRLDQDWLSSRTLLTNLLQQKNWNLHPAIFRHKSVVRSATFSADGSLVVTASEDNTARLWDALSGKPLGEVMTHQSPVIFAAFSADSSRVVTASGNIARLWNAHTGKPLGDAMRHEGYYFVISAIFSADGSRVVTASNDHTARLWDAHTGKPLGEVMTHENDVNSAAFSPDGSRVVTASDDHKARLWDAQSGKPLGEAMIHEDNVTFASVFPYKVHPWH